MKLSDFTGARRIPLIGRYSLLQEAERRLRQGGIHLLYFEGEGGIGKTALLETILDRSQLGGEGYSPFPGSVADEIIDLYHADVHTPEGLIRRIVQVLGKPHFHRTQQQLSTLDWARSVGDVDAAGAKPSALHESFLLEFSLQAEDGIVLAFDTMEVLEDERDPFQAKLGKEVPILGTGEWLFESFFPVLQGNVLILLAGRPDGIKGRLRALRQRNPRIQFRAVNVEALQEDETVEYLKAVAHLEGQRGDFDAATRAARKRMTGWPRIQVSTTSASEGNAVLLSPSHLYGTMPVAGIWPIPGCALSLTADSTRLLTLPGGYRAAA